MEMLPSTGWADVATKGEVAHLREEMRLRFDAVEQRLEGIIHREVAALRTEIQESFRKYFFATIGLNCTIMGLVAGAARFL